MLENSSIALEEEEMKGEEKLGPLGREMLSSEGNGTLAPEIVKELLLESLE